MSKLISIDLEEEDITLISNVLQDINDKYKKGVTSPAKTKLDELILKFTKAKMMTDSRIKKLFGKK